MHSEQEIQNVRKDTDRWRLMVHQLRRYNADTLPDKDVYFLDSLAERSYLEVLSERQAEWLLDISRSVDLVSSVREYSLKYLIRVCYENRFAFEDEDRAWIEDLYRSGLTIVRRYEAWRVYKLAKQIGEVDDWAA